MKVDINTKMITLLGLPLTQSFAARMQNKGYEAAGLNMVYFYTETDNEHLGDIVNGLRYMNFAGFSQTSLKAVPSPSSMTSTRILLLSQSSSLMETFRNYRPAMWSLTPAALAWGVPSGKRRSPRNT